MGIELWAGMFVIGMWTVIVIAIQQYRWYKKSKRNNKHKEWKPQSNK